MFTERHRYILKLLTYLAVREEDGYVTMSEACEELEIPRGYLNRVIPELVELDYLESKKGRGGGVRLARSPAKIQMVNILDDTDAIAHQSDNHETCCAPKYFDHCIVDEWMDDFRLEILSDTTLEDSCERMTGGS